MLAHNLAVIALLAIGAAALAPACAATVDSAPAEADETGANMTPAEEDTRQAAQDLAICECSVESDFCAVTLGGRCVANFNSCTKPGPRGCGFAGLYPCVGWCVRA